MEYKKLSSVFCLSTWVILSLTGLQANISLFDPIQRPFTSTSSYAYLPQANIKTIRIAEKKESLARVYLTDHETLIAEILSKKTDVTVEGVIQREDIEAFERIQIDKRKKREEAELEEIFETPIVEAARIKTDSGRKFDAQEIIPLLLEKALTESSSSTKEEKSTTADRGTNSTTLLDTSILEEVSSQEGSP